MMSYSYARLLSSPQIARTVERGGTAYTMNTAGIGARAQASVPVQARLVVNYPQVEVGPSGLGGFR
jgi:hypothetical protein